MPEPTTAPQVVALCGSLRDDSRTRIVLRELLGASRDRGAATELIDLREYNLPPLDADAGPAGDAEALRDAVEGSDSVVLGSPNYHGSYSGVLKNALDYCGRDEFGGATVGLLEVAAGEFPGSALVHLRTVVRTLHGWALPTEVAVPNSHSTVGSHGIADDEIADRVRTLGTDLVRYARLPQAPAQFEERTGRQAETDD